MPTTIEFEFELEPIERIEPWGTAPDRKLHWFGLSSGWYYIRLADIDLLRYSADALALRVPTNNEAYAGPYVDYQLARLHEDLLALLPSSATPMPQDVARLFRRKPLLQVVAELAGRIENLALHDPALDELEHVFELYRDCSLDTLYLVQGQKIVFWSDGDDVIAEWDSREPRPDAPRTWAVASGTRVVPRSDFIDAVTALHEGLILQMNERVSRLVREGGVTGVEIDLAELRRDHERRATGLAEALAALPKSRDWDAIRGALRKHVSV